LFLKNIINQKNYKGILFKVNKMKLFKAFVAGMILPSFILPFILLFLKYQYSGEVITHLPGIYMGSLFWGLWNIVFILTKDHIPLDDRNVKIGIYGSVYGLFSVLINSFYFEFTSVITCFSDSFIIIFFIIYPILLYFIWKYIVNGLNLLFEVY